MNKPASTTVKILDEIKNRWSPRAFSDKPVEPEKLKRIFEAARWSASSFNEQPWRFLAGIKGQGETWDKIFYSLSEWNQKWCKTVPILVLLVCKKSFTRNDKINAWAEYDLGQAAAYISIQAMAEGLYTHQMGGFNRDTARETFNIPEDFEPTTMMAIGYYGNADALPEDMQKSEKGERSRKEISTIVFADKWNEMAAFVK
ncbi:MAG TPA: nitroreductase [Caldithrix sp.]|nr:nitroreductase family protein [Calditrichaceae bacterium]HEM49316.1 nitroreductase [Caldithrix sp.]